MQYASFFGLWIRIMQIYLVLAIVRFWKKFGHFAALYEDLLHFFLHKSTFHKTYTIFLYRSSNPQMSDK